MTKSKFTLPILSHEIRLGLVLYGGISLAIYMNGICQEFYNAVRGRGIYKLIKALTDSDIVIDIISGTSAGGVNGILLSYAIANSSQDTVIDFKDFAELWIENGDIEKLLARKYRSKDKYGFDSVLDGEGFYRETLEKALQGKTILPPDNDWYSEFSELDLFVTATDLDGQIKKVPDNTGNIIEIKNHRAVFHLEYRHDQSKYIDNPFKAEEATQKALAKLCRMTSCFPVAFPVVEVKLYPEDKDLVDCKLVKWGKLYNRELNSSQEQECSLFFVDGGVLNNRPFSSTVQSIYARTAYRPAERKLFYIDPNPDKYSNPTNQKLSESNSLSYLRKNPFKIAFDSKIEIPNYQSISRDLENIKENNRKVIRHQLLKQSLEQKDINKLQEFLNANKNDETNKYDDLKYVNYLKCRLLGLLDYSIKDILDTTDEKSDQHETFLHQAAELLNKDILSEFAKKDLKKFDREFIPIDITFFIRKHHFLLSLISTMIQEYQENNNIKQYLELRYLAYQLTWQLELLMIIEKAIKQILNAYEFDEILDKGKAGESQFTKLYNFLITFHKKLLGVKSDIHENLTTAFKDDLLVIEHDSLLEIRDDCHLEEKKPDKSWVTLLESYYELFKVIHFPNDINFQRHTIDWSDLKILLPEQEVSLAKKIFDKIYEMPICQVLTITKSQEKRQIISRFKTDIARQLLINNENHQEDEQGSILEIIDKHSRKFIDNILRETNSINPDAKVILASYFDNFEVIDKVLYPYEYLSDVVTKNTIDLIRVSPNDANKVGFGKGKNMQIKLRGYELNAFGGFFKKAWRSNDILWGRLDGLDRIVTALITPKSLKKFELFCRKYQVNSTPEDFLGRLIDESLPTASNEERISIINYLQCISQDSNCDTPHSEKEFKDFLNHIIKAGQRQILLDDILTQDLKNTEELMKDKYEYKQIISELQESIYAVRCQLNDRILDEKLVKKLDDCFAEYQGIKQSKQYKKYKKISLNMSLFITIFKVFFWNNLHLKISLLLKLLRVIIIALVWSICQICWGIGHYLISWVGQTKKDNPTRY